MDRILTTHVGSLIRPADLVPFVRAVEHGEPYDESAFAAVLRAAVADVVRRQAEVGIDIVDDGEMGKVSWITYLYDRVSGIEARIVPLGGKNILPPTLDREAFGEYYEGHDIAQAREVVDETSDAEHAEGAAGGTESGGVGKLWVCTGPIRYDGTALEIDIANLKAGLEGVDVVDAFLPVVAPASVYWLENEYYDSDEEFVFAVADALHEEYARIVDAGFILQVDDAVLWHKYGTIRVSGGTPDDYRRWASVRVEALNHALRGIPPERVRYHICTGSGHGPHTIDPNLTDVLEFVLAVNARTILLEQANARHEHEWRVWEEVELPDDKVLAPGVVTHHTEMVEHPELVAQRLVRLAKIVGRERVVASTDCGFAQMAPRRRVPEWTQWAKLEALVEGARLASRELWGKDGEG